ncbi:MAG: hypothetical protein ACR2MN_04105 [Acidimicrobiales bacterium]
MTQETLLAQADVALDSVALLTVDRTRQGAAARLVVLRTIAPG